MKNATKILFIQLIIYISSVAMTFESGEISGTWTTYDSPYYITDSVYIPGNDSLVIEPGCSIIFLGNYKFIVDSNAVLKAIGTEADSIYFTSMDTSVGHHGMRFIYPAAGCTLEYCRIEFGKASGDSFWDSYGGGIFLFFGNLVINHCLITHNEANAEGGGIYSLSSNLTLLNSEICNNKTIMFSHITGAGGGLFINDYYENYSEIYGNYFHNNYSLITLSTIFKFPFPSTIF